MPATLQFPLTVPEWQDFKSDAEGLQRLLDLCDSLARSKDCAWISLASKDQVRQQWDALASLAPSRADLPLYGVPFAVKDNIDAEGFESTAACPQFAYRPAKDAFVVSRLRAAGAILLGKTNLDQFATGLNGTRSPYGAVPNSFDPNYVSGGSSSGSASVVARGLVPFSLGTDTAGSGRVPAGLNNLVGVKPTPGRISTNGVLPACRTLDCVSIFALTLDDAETVLNVASGYDPEDTYSSPQPCHDQSAKVPSDPTVAICKEPDWYGDMHQAHAWDHAVSHAESLGWALKQEDFTTLFSLANLLYEGPWVAERYAAIREFIEASPEAIDPTVRGIIMKAKNFDAADYFEAQYLKDALIKQIEIVFSKYDAVLVPTTPTFPTMAALAAEPVLENSRLGTYTNFVNFLKWSAISIPAGFREDGLPFGVTIISKSWNEEKLFHFSRNWLSTVPRRLGATNESYQEVFRMSSVPQVLQFDSTHDSGLELVVVGAHLSGLPLNVDLTDRGARLVRNTKTAPRYRLYELDTTSKPPKPGLQRVDKDEIGHSIDVEVWSLPSVNAASFVKTIAPFLAVGRIELIDGEWTLGFVSQRFALEGATDISAYGGWKAYLSQGQDSSYKSEGTATAAKPMFNKVLIANRGEIAVRITSTLKKLGIHSVAIYSEHDLESAHVSAADTSIQLEGSTLSETYLNAPQIVEIAKSIGVDAIIPGYGFLSENAEFASLCEGNGIAWIGPTPEQMNSLGLKHMARELAERSGVPLVPGSGLLYSLEDAYREADRIGYPIMLKSTAGGGGIGLYMCDSRDQLADSYEKVKKLSKSSFDNDGLFVERFIKHARHIEVQILGDGKGNVKHAGERDCSLQRRNQKVVEESPPAFVPENVRENMRRAAIQLGASIAYRNVGTVEFIFDSDTQDFFFLEVNTRLQVEHPVTESTSGLDLVECMVRIAFNGFPEFFAMSATGVPSRGYSIEARIYAESPLQNFRPSHGSLVNVEFPSDVRVDTWIRAGIPITSSFDPMLAKLIASGKTRDETINKLYLALENTSIQGVETNINYLRSVVRSKWFSTGDFTTKTLDSYPYSERAFEILDPGTACSVQELPGRLGFWHLGVPPSGPMDDLSFRIANKIVGNHQHTSALECTMSGPRIKFHADTVVAVAGGAADVMVDGHKMSTLSPISIYAGQTLSVGALKAGYRAYIAIRGGVDVPEAMGSRATFALGKLGGHNGRNIQAGDILRIGSSCITTPCIQSLNNNVVPIPGDGKWEVSVLPGPHDYPYFTKEGFQTLFSSEWKVHYNSNRLGVRLSGPKPQWAREDGGEAGIHPSNIHDSPYSIGSISFTGDEAIVLTCDGPSLGGFVVFANVLTSEMWKIGQMKPGDRLQLKPVRFEDVRLFDDSFGRCVSTLCPLSSPTTEPTIEPKIFEADDQGTQIVARLSGDRALLLEYGTNVFDISNTFVISALVESHKRSRIPGVTEFTPGVRSLHVYYEPGQDPKDIAASVFSRQKEVASGVSSITRCRSVQLPLAFDDTTSRAAIQRYQKTIRAEAPWLPSNADFLRDVNGLQTTDEIKDILLSANYLVLGLGDVYLGSPCAIPLDPRHRLFGTKYNPSRSFTPEGTVGIGGQYLCVYGMDSPGGYQLVGRTIPIWNRNSNDSSSALFKIFDHISFYPISEAELEGARKKGKHMDLVKISTKEFNIDEYKQWLSLNGLASSSSMMADRLEKVRDLPFFDQLLKPYIPTNSGDLVNRQAAADNLDGEVVRTVMPGRCWKCCVVEGDKVKANDELIWIEANKMEMKIVSPCAGKVVSLLVKEKDVLEPSDIVAVIKPL